MVQRCLETDGLGYEVFNVANADMSVAATTKEIQERFYDGVEVRREMGHDETFYAIDKARGLLNFAPQHSWRDVLQTPELSPPDGRGDHFMWRLKVARVTGTGARRNDAQNLVEAD
jgi:hypothetical protein